MDKKIEKFPKGKNEGFSLIELMVAMFIFVMVMGAMVAVSVSGFQSYVKSRSIKTVSEDIGFAINSITKDVRMGKIENDSNTSPPSKQLVVTRNNSQEKVCYKIQASLDSLDICDETCNSCKKIVDLSGTGMVFDGTSGFRNQRTWPIPDPTVRGWAQINLNIELPSMEKDSIRVQTIVSSRDYGWEETP